MTRPDRRLDGNAAAGPLTEIFAFELTSATSTCAHCAVVSPLGAHELYADAPGWVLRCPGCAQVVLRLARTPGRALLDLRGSRLLQIATPD
jgi:Family of unknown function (DUF6510)